MIKRTLHTLLPICAFGVFSTIAFAQNYGYYPTPAEMQAVTNGKNWAIKANATWSNISAAQSPTQDQMAQALIAIDQATMAVNIEDNIFQQMARNGGGNATAALRQAMQDAQTNRAMAVATITAVQPYFLRNPVTAKAARNAKLAADATATAAAAAKAASDAATATATAATAKAAWDAAAAAASKVQPDPKAAADAVATATKAATSYAAAVAAADAYAKVSADPKATAGARAGAEMLANRTGPIANADALAARVAAATAAAPKVAADAAAAAAKLKSDAAAAVANAAATAAATAKATADAAAAAARAAGVAF